MSFIDHLEILSEKMEQAEFVAYGYKWGKEEKLELIVRQLRKAIVIQENIIKEIIDQSSPRFKEKMGGR